MVQRESSPSGIEYLAGKETIQSSETCTSSNRNYLGTLKEVASTIGYLIVDGIGYLFYSTK